MDLGLSGRSVLVTGGSRGVGAAAVRAFAADGARVALTYHRGRDQAEELAKQIEADGCEAVAVPLDLADGSSAAAAVETVVGRFGGLDVLVNNAVWYGSKPFDGSIEDFPVEEWDGQVRANLDGHFLVTRAAAPALRASGVGRIVILSADRAERGAVGAWAYGAAKVGLHGFARSLAWDLGRDGVLVNVVLPALVLTDGRSRFASEAAVAALADSKPARRLPSVEDVARMIAFLGSPANGCTTGEVVHITGGLV